VEGAPVSEPLTVFSTPWCGYCHRLERQLERAGIEFREVDIEQDEAALRFVQQINAGNQTVPTVLLPDGTALTNPTLREITERLGLDTDAATG
jgi:mycoredoxin